ncbi:trehalase family glycosidase [Niabella yanshanensis]|uniref:Trehalase family glycosidase n=1 Tax=Niabella yanshanensis TaxID=577386 RepID=A0ABZ0W723_9BACT|nr:trehalase family glycosidase [Niabella yanshanensis]WQD37871.1 trehalase family glycosidase [Niabella yanshanensis]
MIQPFHLLPGMTYFSKIALILIAFGISLGVTAQEKAFSPLLDPAVMRINETDKTNGGLFLWYPGQLSAHLQQRRLKESQERCVNVGYPGKFYAPVFRTVFRKDVNVQASATISWVSTGAVKLVVNGKEYPAPNQTARLPKGKLSLAFEVVATDDLPAVKIFFDGQPQTTGWQASLDGTSWNLAETSPVFGSVKNSPLQDPELLLDIKPVSVLPLRNAEVINDRIIIRKNGYVLIDFFHLEMGSVSFKVKGTGRITAYAGESTEETLNEDTTVFEQRAIPAYSLSGENQTISLPERAVRYIKIFSDAHCELSDVNFTAKVWPVDFQMSFRCDDERINKIWDASVASLHTSTHGFYLDGIKRDYLPWSMDAVLSTFGGDYVFCDQQVSLNSLSVALLPFNPQKTDLGIPDYPLHALIGFDQHFKRYGNFQTILSYRDRIEQLLDFYETIQDERGFISANVGVSWGFVPGWATKRGPDRKGTPAYAQMMLYRNYKIGAGFARQWGDSKKARHYNERAESLKQNIVRHFWDEEQGLFFNGYTAKGELDKGISHHAQYWAILAGLFPENRYDHLFTILPQIAYYKGYVSYEKGYEFMAYAKARKVTEMWDFLFDVFGDWLEQGHSRFPENFSYKKTKKEQLVFYNRPYGLSLCHGANGVPGIVGVLNGIIGFSQSETDPSHYIINPDLMHLATVKAVFPVKEGKIKIEFRKNQKTRIEIPSGCKVTFRYGGKLNSLTKPGSYQL